MATETLSPQQSPSQSPESILATEYIDHQLDRTRQQVKLNDLAAAVVWWLGGMLAALFVFALLDHWLLPLAIWGRWFAWTMLVVGSGYYFVRQVWPLLVGRINHIYAAKVIEDSQPNLKNSLLNYLLLKRPEEKVPSFVVDALGKRAAIDLSHVPVDHVIDHTPLLRLGYALCGLLIVFMFYKFLSPKDPFRSMARVMAPWSDIAQASRVRIHEVMPGNVDKFQGERLEVTVDVEGLRGQEQVLLHFTTDDGQRVDEVVTMNSQSAHRFACQLPANDTNRLGLRQNLTYRISAGDALSPEYRVRVLPAPRIQVEQLELSFPAYTKRTSETLRNQGDIKAIEGTRVKLTARANFPISNAAIEFDAETHDATSASRRRPVSENMQVADSNAIVEFVLQRSPDGSPRFSSYRLVFTTKDGKSNDQPTVHRIEVIADLPPEIDMLQPAERRVKLALDGSLDIELRARDPDFGLCRLELEMEANKKPLAPVPLFIDATGQAGPVNRHYQLRPSKLGLAVGDELILVGLAADNRHDQYGKLAANLQRTDRYLVEITEPENTQSSESKANSADKEGSKNPSQENKTGPNKPDSKKTDNKQHDPNKKPDPNKSDPNKKQPDSKSSEKSKSEEKNKPSENQSAKEKQESGKSEKQDQNQPDQKLNGGSKGGEAGKEQNAGEKSPGEKSQSEKSENGNSGGESTSQPGEKSGEQSKSQNGGKSESASNGSQAGEKSDGKGGEQGGNNQPMNPGEEAGDAANAKAGGKNSEGQPSQQQPKHDGEVIEETLKRMQEKQAGNQPSSEKKDGQNHEGQNPGEKINGNQPPPKSETQGNPQNANDKNAGKSDNSKQQGGKEGTGNESKAEKQGVKGNEKTKGAGQGEQSQAGAGQKPQDQTTGNAAAQGENNDTKKNDADSNKPEQNNEPGSPSQSKKQSSTPGETSGDQSGAGKKGGGQSAKQAGNDAPGSNSPADEGAGAAQEKGQGEIGKQAGQDQKADKATGSAGNEVGKCSTSQPGEKNSKSDPSKQPGGKSGEEPGKSKSKGQEDSKGANTSDPVTGGGSPGEGLIEGANANRKPPETEAENLEYAKKATEMALQHLKDQQNNPDPELLKRLGWTKEELAAFLRRWEDLKRGAKEDKDARPELDEAYRSLGLRPAADARRSLEQRDDNARSLRDAGARSEPPAGYADQFRAFRKGVSKSKP